MSFPTKAASLFLFGLGISGQTLDPDSYAIAPRGTNILATSVNHQWGDVNFDPSIPVDDASARVNIGLVSYGRALNLFGRSGTALVAVPYSTGRLQGLYRGQPVEVNLSGLADPRAKLTINIYGGPAMTLGEIVKKPPRTIVGVSFTAAAPLGQYDPQRLVNIGANRWSLRPEIGVSHTLSRRWRAEAFLGTWFFTDNNNFVGSVRTQKPITSGQAHIFYSFRPRMWVALNANYFYGGRTTIGGVANFDLQANSRLGATLAVPLGRRSGLRFAGSYGAVNRIGTDFIQIGMSYSYFWGGGF